jgi:hypothetical protein
MVLVDYIGISLHAPILLATCTVYKSLTLIRNKNHSYKHNEQINSQNIENSECFDVKLVKIYPEMTSQ